VKVDRELHGLFSDAVEGDGVEALLGVQRRVDVGHPLGDVVEHLGHVAPQFCGVRVVDAVCEGSRATSGGDLLALLVPLPREHREARELGECRLTALGELWRCTINGLGRSVEPGAERSGVVDQYVGIDGVERVDTLAEAREW
jgi:hypothetical protein